MKKSSLNNIVSSKRKGKHDTDTHKESLKYYINLNDDKTVEEDAKLENNEHFKNRIILNDD